jgi:hypothetical protein
MKTKVVSALAVLMLGLTGCGSSSEPQAVKTIVVTQAPADDTFVAPVSPAGNLASAVQNQDPWFNSVDSATIVETAQTICDALQSGASANDIMVVAESTIGLDHAPAIIAGAVVYLCPDQGYKFQ